MGNKYFAIVVDNRIYQYVPTLVYSILKNVPTTEKVFVISQDDTIQDFQSFGEKVQFINYKKFGIDDDMNKMDLKNHHFYWGPIVYVRLFMPKLLPEYVDKVLYLDADTIVCGNIDELWDVDLTDYACLMSMDLPGGAVGCWRQCNKNDYYNSGFNLMNLDYWRKNQISEKLVDLLKREHLPYPDQDAVNYICAGKIYKVDKELYNTFDFQDLSKSKIIHFVKNKPWKKRNSYNEKWFSYKTEYDNLKNK